MDLIASTMDERGHSSAVIEKILDGNFHRVFGDIWQS